MRSHSNWSTVLLLNFSGVCHHSRLTTSTVFAEEDGAGAAADIVGATVDSGSTGAFFGIRLPFRNFIIGM